MALLILENLIGLCNATGVDTLSIEVKTSNDHLIAEKINEITWAIDTDDDTVDDDGERNNTKFVNDEELMDWFKNEQIQLILLNNMRLCQSIIIYKA